MRINTKELQDILDKHKKWLCNDEGGVRADLRDADLAGANLRGANLTGADLEEADLIGAYLTGADLKGADLRGAYLAGANLTGADLEGADLRGAYLGGANLAGVYLIRANLAGADLRDTILDGINWLAYIGVFPDHQGTARAFKVVTDKGQGIYYGGIDYLNGEVFKVDDIDEDIKSQCGKGINLATFQWCLQEYREGRKLIMFSFNVKDAVCPIGSDGKFRVRKCRKIGECDWKGNLIKTSSRVTEATS